MTSLLYISIQLKLLCIIFTILRIMQIPFTLPKDASENWRLPPIRTLSRYFNAGINRSRLVLMQFSFDRKIIVEYGFGIRSDMLQRPHTSLHPTVIAACTKNLPKKFFYQFQDVLVLQSSRFIRPVAWISYAMQSKLICLPGVKVFEFSQTAVNLEFLFYCISRFLFAV